MVQAEMHGQYRWCWAGDTPQYTLSPYFDRRRIYLPSIRDTVTQVLVNYLGSRVWINVREGDLV
jgi:hypothetical protein